MGPEQREEWEGRREQGRGEVEAGGKVVERLPDTLGGGLTAGSGAREEKRLGWEAGAVLRARPTCSTCSLRKLALSSPPVQQAGDSISETLLTWLSPLEP